MWDTPDWQAWPGRIEAKNTIYDFLLTTGQSPTQGYVSQFVITLDAPDVEETLDDVAVSALGTRLPITKTYSVITNVQLT
ncbi:hypothetical protein, partial [Zavarzinella formosa]|uniref:hypothetical protein n=1 Tax=Zavarzinella formosa TaxID=360055 RepID=UPI00138B192A